MQSQNAIFCHQTLPNTIAMALSMMKCGAILCSMNFKVLSPKTFIEFILLGVVQNFITHQVDASSLKNDTYVVVLLHMHSGIGYFVTSLPVLLVLSSGCPKESRCKPSIILLNSASGRDESIKYRSICLLFGMIVFLCPA